ncbi:hypothetical protein R1flu_016505 [Riccia fluitans]|uniref:FAS1 domain-containing protein n=1 Tax=Riccia fluitans TaxID=41844 RepID=A0ABD1YM13_9MARC
MGPGKPMGRGTTLLPLLITWCFMVASVQSTFDITAILDGYPNFIVLNRLLSSSGIAAEINARRSLTLLVVSDDTLNAFINSNQNADAVKVADLLRFHVLLQFFSMDQLKALPTTNFSSITTLLQTTGKAIYSGKESVLNIYNTLQDGILIGPALPGASSNATIVANITSSGFDISIMQINNVLIPVGFSINGGDLAQVLTGFYHYNTFIRLLNATGVTDALAAMQGQGLTVFAPTDAAFSALSKPVESLPEDEQKQLMEYHVIESYLSLDSFKPLVDSHLQTLAATLATKGYKLNVTGLFLQTGIVNVTIGDVLEDTNPVAMYSVDTVLLPEDLFANLQHKRTENKTRIPHIPHIPTPSPQTINDTITQALSACAVLTGSSGSALVLLLSVVFLTTAM